MIATELLRTAIGQLQAAGCDTPRLDAELLLMHVWGMTRTQLIIKAQDQVPSEIEVAFNLCIKRRCQREPVAYIMETKEFWSRDFHVTPDVLIPRPETEHLIEEVLKRYPDTQSAYRFADIGTGSGCIAITLAAEYPNACVIATDISAASLNIAKANAEHHQLTPRMQFYQGDLYQALPESCAEFDAIISNPPYVSQSEMGALEAELHHEPAHALTDYHDGLQLLKRLVQDAPKHLKPEGFLLLETGLCGLPKATDFMTLLDTYQDLAGHLRGGIYQYHLKH